MPAEPIEPDVEAWDAGDPATLTAMLDGIDTPWCVAGGWALDLFRGEQTRAHADLEITVPAAGFALLRARLAGYEFFVAGGGRLWPLEDAGDAFFDNHQTWMREPATGKWRVDVMREPHVGDTWICRRDPSIRRPYTEIIARTDDGIPYLRPEIVLLFKAKYDRSKDDDDFAGVVSRLDARARDWLERALSQVYGADHRWLAGLR